MKKFDNLFESLIRRLIEGEDIEDLRDKNLTAYFPGAKQLAKKFLMPPQTIKPTNDEPLLPAKKWSKKIFEKILNQTAEPYIKYLSPKTRSETPNFSPSTKIYTTDSHGDVFFTITLMFGVAFSLEEYEELQGDEEKLTDFHVNVKIIKDFINKLPALFGRYAVLFDFDSEQGGMFPSVTIRAQLSDEYLEKTVLKKKPNALSVIRQILGMYNVKGTGIERESKTKTGYSIQFWGYYPVDKKTINSIEQDLRKAFGDKFVSIKMSKPLSQQEPHRAAPAGSVNYYVSLTSDVFESFTR
jgi:hypothetical protein